MGDISEICGQQAPRGVRRRELLTGTAATLGAGLAAAVSFAAQAQADSQTAPPAAGPAATKPNIIFILADDLGWKDVGFHGSDIKTPNLDALAKTGVELEEFYVQHMCTPTRAALITGRYPMRYGLQMAVIPSAGRYGLATDEFTMAQMFQAAGYQTALIGKWHLGHYDKKYWPNQRGFEYSYGPLIGEIDHFTHSSHGVPDWYRNNAPVTEPGYDTTLFGEDAVRLIDGHDTTVPLFLYLAFTAPHTPYQAPQHYLDMYETIADPQRRAYAAQITAMDEQIGAVVAALDKRGMRDSTLIMFCSDNGGTRSNMFAGEAVVKGPLPPDNGPYRDGKGSVYEGGTRVVALANWPGHIKPGKADGMIHVVDMYPTFAGLAGAPPGRNKPLDGMDVWATISEGQPSPRTEMVYNVEPYRAGVRDGNMKLVWTTLLPQQVELFDLASDPGETTNLAAQQPQTVAKMQAQITELSTQAVPPLFLTELLRLGLSHAPVFPDMGGTDD